MTREEQITETAKEYYNPKTGIPCSLQMRVGFITGAQWADETMIEKACEWLQEKNKMCMFEIEMILGNNFIEDFKKAMKE